MRIWIVEFDIGSPPDRAPGPGPAHDKLFPELEPAPSPRGLGSLGPGSFRVPGPGQAHEKTNQRFNGHDACFLSSVLICFKRSASLRLTKNEGDHKRLKQIRVPIFCFQAFLFVVQDVVLEAPEEK